MDSREYECFQCTVEPLNNRRNIEKIQNVLPIYGLVHWESLQECPSSKVFPCVHNFHVFLSVFMYSGNDNRAHRPNGTDLRWAAQTSAFQVNIVNTTVRYTQCHMGAQLHSIQHNAGKNGTQICSIQQNAGKSGAQFHSIQQNAGKNGTQLHSIQQNAGKSRTQICSIQQNTGNSLWGPVPFIPAKCWEKWSPVPLNPGKSGAQLHSIKQNAGKCPAPVKCW